MKFLWLTVYFSALVWSAVNPQDYFTWFLEAAPALIVLVILAATYKRFPLTPLAYTLILCHCLILFLGAHYTYAEVDTFKFVREFLRLATKQLRQARPLHPGICSGDHRP